MMYQRVPLYGDFQLDCELSSTVGREDPGDVRRDGPGSRQ